MPSMTENKISELAKLDLNRTDKYGWFSGWNKARGRLKIIFQTASGCLVKSGLGCQPQPPHLPQPLLQSCFFGLNKNFRKRKNRQASMMMPTIIY